VLNKPKGIWIAGNRLWTTKVELPGVQFANDPVVKGKTLYVSDNRGDAVFTVEPADFLNAGSEPKVTRIASGQSLNPNGLYPARDGSILERQGRQADPRLRLQGPGRLLRHS